MKLEHWQQASLYYLGSMQNATMLVKGGELIIMGKTGGERGYHVEAKLTIEDVLEQLPAMLVSREAATATAHAAALLMVQKEGEQNVMELYDAFTDRYPHHTESVAEIEAMVNRPGDLAGLEAMTLRSLADVIDAREQDEDAA